MCGNKHTHYIIYLCDHLKKKLLQNFSFTFFFHIFAIITLFFEKKLPTFEFFLSLVSIYI